MVAEPKRLPPELGGVAAWLACVADARPLAEYAALFTAAGLRVSHTESHEGAMSRMIDQIEVQPAGNQSEVPEPSGRRRAHHRDQDPAAHRAT